MSTGDRLTFPDFGVEIIVTTGGDGEISVQAAETSTVMPGKRFSCPNSGIQVLVLKPGKVTLLCSGTPMELQEPKKTKAAD
jgi:hypothetical protein